MRSQINRLFAGTNIITHIVILILTVELVFAQTELITNGGFESGSTGWGMSGAIVSNGEYPHTGSRYAILGEFHSVTDVMYQTVTIPATATSATLTFWYNIGSEDAGAAPNDVLTVTIQNQAGTSTSELVAVYANTDRHNAARVYSQKSFPMTQYRGQTVRLNFLCTTNGSLVTSFKIDDVSISTVTPDHLAFLI